MISSNPFGDFRKDCETALKKAFSEIHPAASFKPFSLDIPPDSRFGELAAVFFDLAKEVKKDPRRLAKQVADAIEAEDFPLIETVKAAGQGYVNFYADYVRLSDTTIKSARALNTEYGYVKTETPEKIVVEHTSKNPISPLHIGQARNPILGDTLARMLAARGHTVSRHFYIDDVGRQTAVIAYGYQKLGKPVLTGKPDHYVGLIYAITSCLVEINRLKQATQKIEQEPSEDVKLLQKHLDEWTSIAAELKDKNPKLFYQLLEKINEEKEVEKVVNTLNRNYEAGEENARKLVREVCQLCLQGIRETLSRLGVAFDSWDWESKFAWNSEVAETLQKLKTTGYVSPKGAVLEFDADRVAEDLKLKHVFGLKDDYEIPSLTLVRADGTTLYTTRDIPYTLWKFGKATKVINVVGMEQKLPQQQLKLALWALGHSVQARNLTHFAYSLVRLPEYKMSGRRGHYITLDEVLDETLKRAYREVEKRSPQLSEKEKRRISEIVSVGALKYALVEVDPSKPVVFTWDRVLNFERNSAPYIQYSYARARSILRKAQEKPKKPDYGRLENPLERDLLLAVARFPEVFVDATENLKPSALADYVNMVADKFNSFYNALPVIKAKPKSLSDARYAVVEAISIVLRNCASLLGIVAPDRM